MAKQRYFLNLLIYDCEKEEVMRGISFESTMLDEVASSLRSAEIDLLKIQQERDEDRYELDYSKDTANPQG